MWLTHEIQRSLFCVLVCKFCVLTRNLHNSKLGMISVISSALPLAGGAYLIRDFMLSSSSSSSSSFLSVIFSFKLLLLRNYLPDLFQSLHNDGRHTVKFSNFLKNSNFNDFYFLFCCRWVESVDMIHPTRDKQLSFSWIRQSYRILSEIHTPLVVAHPPVWALSQSQI